MEEQDVVRWTAKHDAFRETTDFSDLMIIVASYYEMYSKATSYIGPWISRQLGGTMFIPPDKEEIKRALGKERASISYRARNAFIDSLLKFLMQTKGKKTLIMPSPSSHHSAQFQGGTFNISQVSQPNLRDEQAVRKKAKTIHSIEFFGAAAPVYIENLSLPVDKINFVILRPKLGKLGTPSSNRWEVLLYSKPHSYLIDHVDSHLSPRYAGVLS
jgi:hypothetical protein